MKPKREEDITRTSLARCDEIARFLSRAAAAAAMFRNTVQTHASVVAAADARSCAMCASIHMLGVCLLKGESERSWRV